MSPRAQFLEQRLRLILVQHQFELRQLLAQPARDERQQIRADRRNQRDLEFARQRIVLVARQRNDLIAFLQDAPRERQDLRADLGERDAAGLALDQLHAQIVLELLDLRRQRRLADERALGGLAEVPRVGQRDEVAQVAQVHGSRSWARNAP